VKIKIGNKTISRQGPLYYIADIASNHDGNLDRALDLIDLAKQAGADAVKFQNFKAPHIVSKTGFETLGGKLSHQASWKKPVFQVYEDASLSYDWTPHLKAKCDTVGIEYMSSAYDFASVDHVDQYVRAHKIGSGDITWIEIIKYIARKRKPVILSSGSSTMADVVRAMNALQKINSRVVLLQCNTNYTAKAENFRHINLRVLQTYRKRFPGALLGLSDHTLGHATVVAAVALGAVVFEKHFTDDNSREGPDHFFAMTPSGWREMMDRANEAFLALGDGIKRVEENEADTAVVQRRALRYTANFPAGHIVKKQDIIPLRPIPAKGLPPYAAEKIIGKKLKIPALSDTLVQPGDVQ
jgi:N-acetylneuraminate synthase